MSEFAGRTAVITGGESGIGRATARQLARAGARVFIGDAHLLPENRAEFQQLGITSRYCDVRTEKPLQQLIDDAVAATGRLDILVNNAGIGLVKPITDVTEAEWDASMDINVKGAFFGCKHAVKHMQRLGGGAIVNTASNAGLLPRVHDPVYSISKHALIALTKTIALCHSGERIRVNAVCPGPVGDTGMMNSDLDQAADREQAVRDRIAASPLAKAWGRMITPEEVAEAICYLASDAARMVTGTSLAIDGGKALGVPPVFESTAVVVS